MANYFHLSLSNIARIQMSIQQRTRKSHCCRSSWPVGSELTGTWYQSQNPNWLGPSPPPPHLTSQPTSFSFHLPPPLLFSSVNHLTVHQSDLYFSSSPLARSTRPPPPSGFFPPEAEPRQAELQPNKSQLVVVVVVVTGPTSSLHPPHRTEWYQWPSHLSVCLYYIFLFFVSFPFPILHLSQSLTHTIQLSPPIAIPVCSLSLPLSNTWMPHLITTSDSETHPHLHQIRALLNCRNSSWFYQLVFFRATTIPTTFLSLFTILCTNLFSSSYKPDS